MNLKKIICLLFIPLFVTPVIHGMNTKLEMDQSPNALIGPTYIAGFLKNVNQTDNILQATAVVLIYYDKGIIRKESDIIFGEFISFKPGILFFYTKNSVTIGDTFVIGKVRDFEIFSH